MRALLQSAEDLLKGIRKELPGGKAVDLPMRLLLSVISNEPEGMRYSLFPLPSCATVMAVGEWTSCVVYTSQNQGLIPERLIAGERRTLAQSNRGNFSSVARTTSSIGTEAFVATLLPAGDDAHANDNQSRPRGDPFYL
jgi:hypothetical protein